MHTPTLLIGTCRLHTDMVMIYSQKLDAVSPSSSPCQDSVSLRGSGARTRSCQLMLRRTVDSRTSCTCSSFSCLSQITRSTHIIATGGIRIVEGMDPWDFALFSPQIPLRWLWGPVHSQETDSSCVKQRA